MLKADRMTPRDIAYERLRAVQAKEVAAYLRTGKPPVIATDLRPRPAARRPSGAKAKGK